MKRNDMHIVFIAYPDVQNLDITGPWEVFASANRVHPKSYQLTLATLKGGPLETSSGLKLDSEALSQIDEHDVDMVLIPGGWGSLKAARNQDFLHEIKRLASKARRVSSVCSGAFLLAAAGFLHGRRATTHWQSCDMLASQYADIDVDRQSIYVQDGPVWTSAGVTTGIDMALSMVSQDLGADTAMRVARGLVVYHHRPGYQAQFSSLLQAQSISQGPFSDLVDWMMTKLDQPLKVDALAERVAMTPRSFHRKFSEAMGCAPGKFLERLRLDAARRLLGETKLSVKEISGKVGYQGSVGFIQAFERHMGLSPTSYRQLHGMTSVQPD